MKSIAALAIGFAAVPPAQAGFRGPPLLLSAEGGPTRAAWVAYQNGELMRCRADTGDCRLMHGLPTFARAVSLSAEPGNAAAWVGLSDGTLYRCSANGKCRLQQAAESSSPRP